MQNAFWKPLYDVRLLEDKSLELTYMANITQETGEDWDEVALALSTARPALHSRLPKLQAWYVDEYDFSSSIHRYQRLSLNIQDEVNSLQKTIDAMDGTSIPVPQQSVADEPLMEYSLSLSDRLGGVAQAAAKVVKPQDRAAGVSQTTISNTTSGAVVTYNVGTPVSIPGNGEPHKTTITITGLQAELDYLTAPRFAPEAYLRANITNTSEYTILPGEASVFHENNFIGKTQVALIAPNDEFEVQLGVDDRIKVEHELVKRDTGQRFIGTMAQTNFEYEINITNLLPHPAKVTVQDQFPVSRSSKIKVKVDHIAPPPKDETDLHILTWETELAPEAQQTFSIAFTIEHGRNQRVYGLDD